MTEEESYKYLESVCVFLSWIKLHHFSFVYILHAHVNRAYSCLAVFLRAIPVEQETSLSEDVGKMLKMDALLV